MLVHVTRQYHWIPFTIIMFFIVDTGYSCVICSNIEFKLTVDNTNTDGIKYKEQ